ncbi:MAG: glyceraldehyde 3-phosphate dehydrogenase NAD-binding domain-containing protein, partial [Paracoccaceae bacterium]|nr:glyceraldehyde 3-phosphate dehydrogenase NAD-binding domain-containing protein [Paracoccaceae bacterium]
MPRIALNGLGRIGKLALRRLVDQGMGADIALLNDRAGTPDQHALLMEFDSVHGRWPAAIAQGDDSLTINGHKMPLTAAGRIEDLPLAQLGIDLVI